MNRGLFIHTNAFLWSMAALLYGVGDLVTTHFAFRVGAHELNPLLTFVAGLFGGGIWAMVLIKVAILSFLFLFSFLLEGKRECIIPYLLIFLGSLLTINNLLCFIF